MWLIRLARNEIKAIIIETPKLKDPTWIFFGAGFCFLHLLNKRLIAVRTPTTTIAKQTTRDGHTTHLFQTKKETQGCVCLLVLRSTAGKMVPMKATKRVVQQKPKANGVVAAKIIDNGGKTVPRLNFCFVLHKFLTEQSNGTTVEWSPCGTRFFLRPEDPEQFAELLKPYFRRKCLLLLAEDPWQCWSAAHGALHCHWSTVFY